MPESVAQILASVAQYRRYQIQLYFLTYANLASGAVTAKAKYAKIINFFTYADVTTRKPVGTIAIALVNPNIWITRHI